MTQDEIIEMATQVYGECDWHESALLHLKRFAKLVAAKATAKEREALAQEQEPVAWEQLHEHMAGPFYQKPPQRTWVGLTDIEIEQAIELISMLHGDYSTEIAYAIEDKLKEKNCAG